jgi:tetratricopeptide (TPR) repeat protein
VGRARELAKLAELFQGAVAGRGGIVFITGEPGIGKTALARAFLRSARSDPSVSIGRGRCVEQYGAGEAYLPFLDALSRFMAGPGREKTLAAMRQVAPTWCLQVPAAVDSPEAREDMQRRAVGATPERMLRELMDGMSSAAAAFPLLLLLEDLQWADAPSIDALRFLGGHIRRQRILVVGTLRPGDLEVRDHPLRSCRLDLLTQPHCHEMALGVLGRGQVAEYLDARFPGHQFPPELAAFVHERTDGHPLFIVSFVELLCARDAIAEEDGVWGLRKPISESDHDVPHNLRDMIRRKVEMLAEPERTALQGASVLGREFPSTVLASLLDVDELSLEERLHRLERAHRVIDAVDEEDLPDGALATRYRFTHGFCQEVVYEDLGSKRRTTLHQRAGQALRRHHGAQAARIAPALALHFERGRDFAGAVAALVQAGENAAGWYAYGEALEHFDHALALADRLPPGEQASSRAQLHRLRGLALYALGRFAESARELTRVLDAARGAGDAVLECAALSHLCDALYFDQRLEEMAVRAHEAVGAAARADSPALQVEALLQVARVLQAEGRPAECAPLFDDAVAAARRLGHERALLTALAYRGLLRYWQADYLDAERTFTEAMDLAERLGDGFVAFASRMHVGLARVNLGRFAEAQGIFDETIEMAVRNGERLWRPRLVSHLGFIRRELKDFPRARAHDEESLRLARQHETTMAAETEALLSLCLDYERDGRRDEARRIIEELDRIRTASTGAWFGWLHELRFESLLSEYELLCGNLSQARTHAQALQRVATELGARVYVAAAHRLQALAALEEGDLGSARRLAEAARDELAGHALPLESWKALATLGRVLARAGDQAAATDAYRQSAAYVREMAGRVDDDALRATFLESPDVREVLRGAAEDAPAAGRPGR